jgi:hypothetical protein
VRALLAATAIGGWSSVPEPAIAQSGVVATSSRAARDEAIRAIPWQRLHPRDRQALHAIVDRASIYRRLPPRLVDCDPDLFSFLAGHPEVVVDVWQIMGVSRVTLDKRPDGAFQGTDGAGTAGTVRYLSANWGPDGKNEALVLAEGSYDGKPFVKTLKAKTVMLLRTAAVQEANGRTYVSVRADTFVQIDQMAVDLIARTVQPWVNATADRNYLETLAFVSNFSRTAERNPDGMRQLAARLASVDPATRETLVALCFQAAERNAAVERARRTGGAPPAASDSVAYASRTGEE